MCVCVCVCVYVCVCVVCTYIGMNTSEPPDSLRYSFDAASKILGHEARLDGLNTDCFQVIGKGLKVRVFWRKWRIHRKWTR